MKERIMTLTWIHLNNINPMLTFRLTKLIRYSTPLKVTEMANQINLYFLVMNYLSINLLEVKVVQFNRKI